MAPVKQSSRPLSETEGESEMGDLSESKFDFCSSLLNDVLERNNLLRALKQVRRNKGAAGIDGMSVDALPGFLGKYWPQIRQKLVDGCYSPAPVKRVEIPKPNGGVRKLGIPTVLDRFIQQALAQILQREWDTGFHDRSYGFRPKRNAQQAIGYAQETMQQDYGWVVDCDLEAFFDCVNHDLLVTKLKAKHDDPPLLRLINRYLKAGVQVNGETEVSIEGVPQGGPLSPILSNIMLNQLDWELERRGHQFVRYADDFIVFVKSQEAGERVKENLQHFISDSLRLKVNTQKSAVDRPWNRTFLGFTFSRRGLKIKVSNKALLKLKATVKVLSRRTRGHSITQVIADLRKSLLGWAGFCSCKTCISTIHGGQSVLRHSRSIESSARP